MYAFIIKSVFRCTSLCFNKFCNSHWHRIVKLFQDFLCCTIPCFTCSLPYIFFTWHLVTNLFLNCIPNIIFGDLYLANILVIPEWISFTFYECPCTFRVMSWRESMHKDMTLLCEHNSFTCHFNILNNITLVFCTIHSVFFEEVDLYC